MSDVTITIGGREFRVSCREGEEEHLRTAAALLDGEAAALAEQIGRLPEARMLLMAGLMLADRTAELERELVAARATAEPEKVEVAVIPDSVTDTLAEIAARAEALAGCLEEQTA